MTITNVGQIPIEMIEVSIQSTLDTIMENKIFKWSDENLMTQLPLQPGNSASLTLYLYAATDFVAPSIRNGNIRISILYLHLFVLHVIIFSFFFQILLVVLV